MSNNEVPNSNHDSEENKQPDFLPDLPPDDKLQIPLSAPLELLPDDIHSAPTTALETRIVPPNDNPTQLQIAHAEATNAAVKSGSMTRAEAEQTIYDLAGTVIATQNQQAETKYLSKLIEDPLATKPIRIDTPVHPSKADTEPNPAIPPLPPKPPEFE